MSKPIIALIVLGVIVFIVAMVIGVDALMCTPPCVWQMLKEVPLGGDGLH